MTPPATIQAWAIKAPDGEVIADTASSIRLKAMRRFFFIMEGKKRFVNFGDAEKEGYRCVRVKIEEVAE